MPSDLLLSVLVDLWDYCTAVLKCSYPYYRHSLYPLLIQNPLVFSSVPIFLVEHKIQELILCYIHAWTDICSTTYLNDSFKLEIIFPQNSGWFFFCLFFLGPHLRHMEAPRLGVQSELQLPAYSTATATQDLSRVCDLHNSSWQRWILNPLSEVRGRTHVLMDPIWVL